MLLGNIWLLSTLVNSSCDIKINIKIVQNCCRNLVVKGLIDADMCLQYSHARRTFVSITVIWLNYSCWMSLFKKKASFIKLHTSYKNLSKKRVNSTEDEHYYLNHYIIL